MADICHDLYPGGGGGEGLGGGGGGGGGGKESSRILCEEGCPQIDREAKGSEEEGEALGRVEEKQKGKR
jgi:hypothetical protein